MTTPKHLKIGITIGDLNGIGPELILKTFADHRMFEFVTPVVYGSGKVLSFYKKLLGHPDFNYTVIKNIEQVSSKRLNLINCWEEDVEIKPGTPTPEAGKYALKSIQCAVKDLKEKKIDCLVTAPINKNTIELKDFAGHTEYLAAEFNSPDHLMFLVSDTLKVGLVTGHIPLNKVSEKLTKELIVSKLKIMKQSLEMDFLISKPRLAVLGINPHAGDNGLIGNEDKNIIAPATEEARKMNMLAYGPYAADGFFASRQYMSFDGVLAIYHDQGLIPFKYIAFEDGVNYTAGLPVIRTSPDHGTAYDIAGKNIASEESFRNAILLAAELSRNRTEEQGLRKNPLRYTIQKRERFRLDF
jgi:4-hydroxythreonine-4-phosphate dehydrogenase